MFLILDMFTKVAVRGIAKIEKSQVINFLETKYPCKNFLVLRHHNSS